MQGKDDDLEKQAINRKPTTDDVEEQMLSEGRRLSVWALVGAAAFVVAMIVLALAVFTSGGPDPMAPGVATNGSTANGN
jgi:hypothetical protein